MALASFVSYSKSEAAEALTTHIQDIWPVGEDRIVETCCRTVRDEETKAVGKTNIGGGVGGCLALDIREQSGPGKTRKDMDSRNYIFYTDLWGYAVLYSQF